MAIKDKKVSEIYAGRDISSLSDRPNQDGLTGAQLKARFDQLGKEVIPNYNDLIDELDDIVLPLKADQATTYNKTETDSMIAGVVAGQFPSFIASYIPIEDTGGYYDETNVEDVLQESGKRYKEVVANIKSYGAVGNANYYSGGEYYEDIALTILANDDTTAIQQAIDDNANVFIPQGNYMITSALTGKTGLALFGVNRFKSKIVTKACDGITFDGNIYYFYLHDFSIHGENKAIYTNNGLNLKNGAAKFLIKNVNIQYFDIGIDMYSTYLSEQYSMFLQYNNTCVKMSGASNGFGCHAHSFIGGEFANSKIGVSAKYGNATKLYGTTIEQCSEYGVYLEPSSELRNLKFDTIYFEANAVDIGANNLANVRIANCYFTADGKPVGYKFIATDNLMRCKIENNVFSASASTDHIARINEGVATYVLDAIITGNDVIDGTALKVGADFTAIVVSQGQTTSNIIQGLNDLITHKNSKTPHNFVGCRVFHSANQTVANGTAVVLSFDSESYDTDTMHSTTTLNNKITFKTAGKYQITAQVSWSANAVGKRSVYLRKNETTYIGRDSKMAVTSAVTTTDQNISVVYDFAVNDFVEVIMAQDSGGDLVINRVSDYSAIFSAERIG